MCTHTHTHCTQAELRFYLDDESEQLVCEHLAARSKLFVVAVDLEHASTSTNSLDPLSLSESSFTAPNPSAAASASASASASSLASVTAAGVKKSRADTRWLTGWSGLGFGFDVALVCVRACV